MEKYVEGKGKGKMPMQMGSRGRASGRAQTQRHESRSNALARQGSLYNLTFDEVQNQLRDFGKPSANMNLDELLKAVSTAESSQAMVGVDQGASSQHSQVAAVGSSLQQQPSAMLSSDLNKRTIDEVWNDIQQGPKNSNLDSVTMEKQPALGGLTLEDFLAKAGVIPETFFGKNDSVSGLGTNMFAFPGQQAPGTNYYVPPMYQPQQQGMAPVVMPALPVQQPGPIAVNPMMNVAMAVSPSPLMGTFSNSRARGRKRFTPSVGGEESSDRKLRTKIKNRNSAARSRARKLLYLQDLENKVSRLKEANEKLKRQKKVDEMLASLPMPKPKYQLRRTSSAPF